MRTAAGIAVGALADSVIGDPLRWHPVAGFGRLAAALERRAYAPTRVRGAAFTAICVGMAALAGGVLGRLGALGVAVATWTALGGRSLAENTSDAAVAPLLAAAVAGAPGVLAYRAINTLDAMVGYRTDRYREFGWASARLDDVANYLPARLTGGLAVVCGSRAGAAVHTWRRDARRHPSPNAGVVEAAFAGSLGIALGGATAYHGYVEDRPVLGEGPGPGVADLRAAVRLSRRVRAGATVIAVVVALSRVRSGRRACA